MQHQSTTLTCLFLKLSKVFKSSPTPLSTQEQATQRSPNSPNDLPRKWGANRNTKRLKERSDLELLPFGRDPKKFVLATHLNLRPRLFRHKMFSRKYFTFFACLARHKILVNPEIFSINHRKHMGVGGQTLTQKKHKTFSTSPNALAPCVSLPCPSHSCASIVSFPAPLSSLLPCHSLSDIQTITQVREPFYIFCPYHLLRFAFCEI